MKERFSMRYCLSLLCFLLSGAVIYNPLYRAEKPVFVSIGAVLVGLCFNFVFTAFFKSRGKRAYAKKVPIKVTCIIAFASLCFASVFFLSEMRASFGYFSDFYGTKTQGLLFTVLILFVCAYAGHRNSEGVFRFCQLVCPMLFAYYVMMFFALPQTGNLILPKQLDFFGISDSGFVQMLLSGVYLFSDIAVFCFVFENETQKESGKNVFRESFTACTVFSVLILLTRVRTSFMFGETLTASLRFCDLASIKLLPHFSFPELFLLFMVFACIIKVSVYVSAAARLLGMLIKKDMGFKADSYLSAFLTLVLSLVSERLLENNSHKDMFFTLSLLASSFLLILVTLFSSKRQNKTL